MSIRLAQNQYGKGHVRLVKVTHGAERNEVKDLTVDILLQGDLEVSYTEGDNRRVLPTDTMKNTVYALARDHPLSTIEGFGVTLAQHFMSRNIQVSQAEIRIVEMLWDGIYVTNDSEEGLYRPHPHALSRRGSEQRTCRVQQTHEALHVQGGLRDLHLLKTRDSAFANFLRDELTTLKDTGDRVFGTDLTATWQYTHAGVDFAEAYSTVRQALLDTFARHESLSVQHTLYAMGRAALEQCADIREIYLSMPNKHRLLVDLTPFGQDNPNVIFVPVDEPYGIIEATMAREEGALP